MARHKYNKMIQRGLGISLATAMSTSLVCSNITMVRATENKENQQIVIESIEDINDEVSTADVVEEEVSNDRVSDESGINEEADLNNNSGEIEATINKYEGLVINEVYGGGGKAGKDGKLNAPFAYDFIEIYNNSDKDIELTGLKLKYTNNSAGTIQEYVFTEGQVIKANDYFLLRCESTVGNMGEKGHGEIFNADAFYDIPEQGIGMSDTKGSVQLLNEEDTQIDAVNFGGAGNGIGEGNSIKGIDHTTSVERKNFQDTNDNATDFEVKTPTPQMSGGQVQILEIKKIEDVKADVTLAGQTISVEATITAKDVKTNSSSDVKLTYIQDFTGGIAIENINTTGLEVGHKLFVTGTLTEVNGELRIDATYSNILSNIVATHPATPFTPKESINNDGWYANVSGRITSKNNDKMVLDNALTVFVDEAIASINEFEVGQFVNVKGILSKVDNSTQLVVLNKDEVTRVDSNYESTLDIAKIAGYDTGMADPDGGVAEIVKFNADNNKFYLINGKAKSIEVVSLDKLEDKKGQKLEKEKSVNIADAVNKDGFVFGDITSIDINTDKKIIVAAVQHEDYKKDGKIVVMSYDCEVLEVFESGIQPDMVKISTDGKYILTADEAEPRDGITGEGWDPEGSVTIVNYDTKEIRKVKFDNTSKIASDVHIRNKKGGAKVDLEPEYITLSDDGTKAYVSLQENNAIATIDVANGKLVSVKSLGFKDHSIKGNELDAGRDGKINIENLPIKGLYMPDSLAQVTIGGVSYLVTANEGDATEWGKKDAEFTNIAEFKDYFKDKELNVTDNTFGGMTVEEAKAKFEEMKAAGNYDKLEVVTDMGDDAIYVLGGRSFAMWKADTMELVYDSGSDFENIIAEVLPGGFNWSNDDNLMDKRSAKKGPEPEDIKIGKVGDKVYAFVGIERVGGIMTYDITNPSEAKFANYINTRDFTNKIAGDVAPEGLEFIPAELSKTGKPLVLVGNEVSGTVSVLQLEVASTGEGFGPDGDVTPEVTPEQEDDLTAGDGTSEDDMQVTPEQEDDLTAGDGTSEDDMQVTPDKEDDVKPEVKPAPDKDNKPNLPQTGSPISMGAIAITGLITTILGALTFKKKKNN